MAEENEVAEEIIIETPEEETSKEETTEASSTEVNVETEVETEEPAKEEKTQEDELDSYSKGVQSRIKKLTEKYRQEERDKAEAVRLSQQLIEENKKLKTRVQSLDSGYLNEYGNRLESQSLSAKQMYKEAHETGDADKMIEAQELISKLAVERQRYDSAKTKAEKQAKVHLCTKVKNIQQ